MSSERPEEFSSPAPRGQQSSSNEAIVVVRGETVRGPEGSSPPKDSPPQAGSPTKDKEKSARKEVSEAKVKMQSRLPALDDDADVGVEKEQIVTRDGKADLGFTGMLLASAGPAVPPKKDDWQEYRVYQTNGGKHIFSKVARSILADKDDSYEADVFDPSPSSVPSQLIRSARELVHSRPFTWKDAAVAFFGYDPLAKALYRKLSVEFEEQIS